MLSIVICGTENSISRVLKKNIDETIGVEYELIYIDNSMNRFSIFQAYNLGVRKAKNPIVCFMHEDVLFHSYNWGNKIISYFADSEIGALGVSGPTFLSRIPGIWWGIDDGKYKTNSIRMNCINTDRNDTRKSHKMYVNPFQQQWSRVVALDGLFMCIRKDLFDKISFDEKYGGFHYYDLDICMQINNLGFSIVVVYDIIMEHISASSLSKEWLRAARIFNKKWKNELPILSGFYDIKQITKMEINNFRIMADILSQNNISLFRFFSFSELFFLMGLSIKDFFRIMHKH